MKAPFALLLVAVAGCFAASAMAAGRAALNSTPSLKSCGNVIGAKWVFPKTGGKITGNKYGVTAIGVSCATALKYAAKFSRSGAKLTGKPVNNSYPLAGGPKGYTCRANPDANGKLLAGSCQVGPRTAVATKVFSWGGRP